MVAHGFDWKSWSVLCGECKGFKVLVPIVLQRCVDLIGLHNINSAWPLITIFVIWQWYWLSLLLWNCKYVVVLAAGYSPILSMLGILFYLSFMYFIITLILILLMVLPHVWVCYTWCSLLHWSLLGLFWLVDCLRNIWLQLLLIIFI